MNFRMSILALPLIANAEVVAVAAAGNITSTVYVGRHFEVRDRDQPVKYLFNGDDRLARVTGSLSNRERIQRLRVQTGWNLASLAVTASNLLGQFEGFSLGPLGAALYRWRPAARDFVAVSMGQTVEAGTVIWLRAQTNALVSIRGTYSEPAPVVLTTGGGYVGSAGLETWSPNLPFGVTAWKYDAVVETWRTSFSGDLEPISDLPPALAPGDVIFIHTSEAVELASPEPAAQLLFYHPDHLGSAVAVTDATGASVHETAYYPFGAERHRRRAGGSTPDYGFTQKERDPESALHYFEARYVASSLGRFSSFDPLLQNLEALEASELEKLLGEPAKLNPFAYALNNPVRYFDPDGRESRETRPRPRSAQRQPRQPSPPKQPGPDLTIRLGPSAKRPGEIPASSYSIQRGRNPNPTTSGKSGTAQDLPNFSEFQVTRPVDDASTGLYVVYQRGLPLKSVQFIIPGQQGKELRLHLKDVIISAVALAGYNGEPVETLTFTAGSVRFGDPAPPAPAHESREQWHSDPKTSQ